MHTLNKVIIWNPYCIERSCELVLSTMQNGVFARLLMHYMLQWISFLFRRPNSSQLPSRIFYTQPSLVFGPFLFSDTVLYIS